MEAEAKIMAYACPNATRFYSVVRAVTGGAWWRRASADVWRMAGGGRRWGGKSPEEAVSLYRLLGASGEFW